MLDEQAGYYLGWVPTCHTLSFRVPNWYQKERNAITLFVLTPHTRQASVKNWYWQNECLSSYSISNSGALHTRHAVIRSVGNISRLSGAFRNEVFVSSYVYMQQDRQCAYNTEARSYNHCCSGDANKYCTFWVCICSLRYQACNAPLYNIFPYYLINDTIFGGKKLLSIKCVSNFSTTFVWNIFHPKMNGKRYDRKSILVLM